MLSSLWQHYSHVVVAARHDLFVKSQLHFNIFLVNTIFDLVTKYILGKNNEQHFHQFIVHTEIL